MQFRAGGLIFGLAIILWAAKPAQCDDFLTSGAGARATAVGGAYLPSSDNALDAIAINPAGLALLGAPTVDLGFEGVFARGKFINRANSGAPLDSNGAIPYGAFGTPLGSGRFTRRLSVGIAVLPELLSSAKWRYNDTPGGVGGVSYGALNSNSQILATRAAAGMGLFDRRSSRSASLSASFTTRTLFKPRTCFRIIHLWPD